MNNRSSAGPCQSGPFDAPFPKAARQALMLWLGIACVSVVTLPVWSFVYSAPEPVRLSKARPKPAAPARHVPQGELDYATITHSIPEPQRAVGVKPAEGIEVVELFGLGVTGSGLRGTVGLFGDGTASMHPARMHPPSISTDGQPR